MTVSFNQSGGEKMDYLLISHGDYAQATLRSSEMIMGKSKHMTALAFKQTMNQDDLLAEIEQTAKKLSDSLTIIVDIKGGTPCNTALRYQAKHPQTKIYAGLSLGLVLAVATGTSFKEAFQQVDELSGPVGDTKPESVPKKAVLQQESVSSTSKSHDETIKNIRIDERLIHGQVATMWTNRLKLTRLMVVDDDIVKSAIQKTALKTACPHDIHLSILTTTGACERIKAGKYIGQTVLLLVKNPHVLRQMFDLGLKMPQINVGNMSTKAHSIQVAKSVAVTPEDINDFNYLSKQGCYFYHQMIPSEKAQPFMNLLSNKEK